MKTLYIICQRMEKKKEYGREHKKAVKSILVFDHACHGAVSKHHVNKGQWWIIVLHNAQRHV